MLLIDTNVISEARKGRSANKGVRDFFKSVDPDDLYLSVITIGELRHGYEKISNRGDDAQAALLGKWMNKIVAEYNDRILVFDEEAAQVWGKSMAINNQHPIDKQIAAIAMINGMDIVTRNVADFSGTGVTTINPFL